MKKIICFSILVVLSFIFGMASAQAELNLSANPIDNSNNIRLGRVDVGEAVGIEVRIRITSTDGKPYQVFQRLVDPIVNEQGQPIGREGVQSYTLSGSNSYGTLYSTYPESLTTADQLIYSSSPSGESDNLTVVYKSNGDQIGASGNFMGRVMYTVRSVGGSGQQNSFLTISLSNEGNFQMEVKGSSAIDEIKVVYDDEKIEDGYLQISWSANPGGQIRVYQDVVAFPQNDLLEEINQDVVVMRTEGSGADSIQNPSWQTLSHKKELLLETKAASGDFDIIYSLNKEAIKAQKSGNFRGQIKFWIEAAGKTEEYRVNLEVQVRPIFRIEVDLPSGGLKFSKILPDAPPQEQEVEVTVKTNLGKPYLVIQNIGSPLTNATGDKIPQKYFTMKIVPVEVAEGSTPGSVEYVPVTEEEQPIFFSDTRGSSAVFKTIYRLTSFPEMKPGDYTTSMTYSLGEK